MKVRVEVCGRINGVGNGNVVCVNEVHARAEGGRGVRAPCVKITRTGRSVARKYSSNVPVA